MASRHDRMTIHNWNGVAVLDLGEMDIWDGADLSLLRDTLTEIIQVNKRRSVGVNLQWVKYIPSGFFGMLTDWHDRGVSIYVYNPQQNVARMLWFRVFFEHLGNGCYRLLSDHQHEPQEEFVFQGQSSWADNSDWD